MKKHMTQEVAIKSAWMILEGLGFSREINGDLEKTVAAVFASAPAADVVEVRHERWDLAKDPFGAGYVKCSRCGYKHCPEYYPDGSAIMHLFCPSCGAKMDGGQDDGD